MLEFRNVSKSFSGVRVLHNISFSVAPCKVTALMGENGAGKSTLMKILSGAITHYEGAILLDGQELKFANTRDAEQAGIAMIYQELNLVPDLTIGENIFLGAEPSQMGFVRFADIHRRADELLKEFDFPYSSTDMIKNIGLGWQQMVEIAKALHLNSKVIIMDEPTSSLTESEKENLFKKIRHLKSLGKTILYISHRMSEIFEIADEVVIMRDGRHVGQSPVSGITREQIVELMIGKKPSAHSFISEHVSPNESLRLNDVTISVRSKPVLKNISFDLKKGEVLGVAGLLGAGRTALLKFLYGAIPHSSFTGEVFLNGAKYESSDITHAQKRRIIYLSEDRKAEGIFASLGVDDNTSVSMLDSISAFGFVNRKKEVEQSGAQLKQLNAKYASLYQPIIRLSGGNQQKVLLSRILLTNPSLILLDEPTRGIDVGAKEEIYQLIQTLGNQGVSIIMSSSEIHELEQVCHRILVLSGGHQTALLDTGKTHAAEVLKYAFEKV